MEYDFQNNAREHTQVQEEPSYQDLQKENAYLERVVRDRDAEIKALQGEILKLTKEQFSAKGLARSLKDVWNSLEFHSPITFKKERESR